MLIVCLTALGVGGATVAGAVFGFLFRGVTQKCADLTLAAAAGVMLAASVAGLLEPALSCGGRFASLQLTAGMLFGGVCLRVCGRLTPHLGTLLGMRSEEPEAQGSLQRVLLFVMAIAVHNLPEGLAAGVSFGTGNTAQALTVAGGIALQNIPEGMVIIAPMLAAGVSPGRTFLCALATGLIEVLGTFLGYAGVQIASFILPFALSFAGGAMLFVIADDMIPQMQSGKNSRSACYALLLGFALMLSLQYALA